MIIMKTTKFAKRVLYFWEWLLIWGGVSVAFELPTHPLGFGEIIKSLKSPDNLMVTYPLILVASVIWALNCGSPRCFLRFFQKQMKLDFLKKSNDHVHHESRT